MNLVPVQIESFLIPYLFEKYDGQEAIYRGVRVKQITITQKTPIGKYIRLLCERVEVQKKNTSYNIFISVCSQAHWKGSIYTYVDGRRSFLALPKSAQSVVNATFKEEFYNAFYFYVNGFAEKGQVKTGIKNFIDRYNLYEFGFNYLALERRYNRERSKRERNAELADLSVNMEIRLSNFTDK